MRILALAAALVLSALATTPAAAQTSRTVLRLTVATGNDDLRGGRDSVRGSYRIGETWSAPRILNTRGQRWADRTTHVVNLDVPTETARGLNRLRLQTNFGGGIDGDNWNMASVQAQVCLVGGRPSEDFCINLARHGAKRFTGSEGTLELDLVWPVNSELSK